MDTPVITVARALDLDVPRAWQEAVAVVMEAGIASQRAGYAATAEHCLVSAAGGLVLQSAPAPGTAPAAALISLLGELLEGQTAPAELRALVTDGARQHAGNLDGFLQALAYFEPPDRRDAIAAFTRRAVAREAQASADAELSDLRRTARRKPHTEVPPEKPKPGSRWSVRVIGIAVAAVAWSLVAVTLAGWYFSNRDVPQDAGAVPQAIDSNPSPGGDSAAQGGGLLSSAAATLDRVAMAGLRAVGLAAPAEESPAPSPPPASAVPGSRKTAPRAATAAPGIPPPFSMAAPPPSAPPTESPRAELPTRAAEPEDAIAPPPPVPVFFSDEDRDVEAPVLVYPQLPSDAGTKPVGADVDHFELLVTETGIVERVRLLARQPRYQDRMMVYAAKAWRFQPATRDGRPVRYLLRLPASGALVPERR